MDTQAKPLERYFAILECVANEPNGLVLAQIAAELSLPGGTTHRLVNSLLEADLLATGMTTKHYVLGPRARRFALAKLLSRDIETQTGDILRKLSEQFSQTVYITKLVGHSTHTMAVQAPAGEVGAIVHPGRSMVLHATATGKSLLAFQSESFIRDVLKGPLKRFTPDTKTSSRAILAELEKVRTERFSICDNEVDLGVLAYAAPIISEGNQVLFALGVCGLREPFSKIGRNVVRTSLQTGAAEIARRLSVAG